MAQLDRASAFEAQPPVPKFPSIHMSFQYIQQLGESASRSKLSPTLRIDRVLAQFWHSNVSTEGLIQTFNPSVNSREFQNLNAPSGVAYEKMKAVFSLFVAPNVAPKPNRD